MAGLPGPLLFPWLLCKGPVSKLAEAGLQRGGREGREGKRKGQVLRHSHGVPDAPHGCEGHGPMSHPLTQGLLWHGGTLQWHQVPQLPPGRAAAPVPCPTAPSLAPHWRQGSHAEPGQHAAPQPDRDENPRVTFRNCVIWANFRHFTSVSAVINSGLYSFHFLPFLHF